jgi:hypothetical protein
MATALHVQEHRTGDGSFCNKEINVNFGFEKE